MVLGALILGYYYAWRKCRCKQYRIASSNVLLVIIVVIRPRRVCFAQLFSFYFTFFTPNTSLFSNTFEQWLNERSFGSIWSMKIFDPFAFLLLFMYFYSVVKIIQQKREFSSYKPPMLLRHRAREKIVVVNSGFSRKNPEFKASTASEMFWN